MENWSERIERQLHAKQRTCEKCGKVRHDSEREAVKVIREYHRRMRQQPYYLRGETPAMVPKRAYFDRRCGTWHVTRQRTPLSGAEPGAEAVFLALPEPPAAILRSRPAVYREAVALTLRDEIRRQGAGLHLPFRRALERHYGVPWPLIGQVRDLLAEVGWLRPTWNGAGWSYVTADRRITETSRTRPASLSA